MDGVTTLSDIAKSLGPNGVQARMINILGQSNEMNEDAIMQEGNLKTGHTVVIETDLPTPVIRRFNQGVSPTKGTSAQITVTSVLFEDRSSVDKALADIWSGRLGEYRMQQGRKHIEGFSQKVAQQLVYGTTNEEIFGFHAQYNSLSGVNADNVISAGGAGSDNMSMLLVAWSPDKCFCVYPNGSTAGLVHDDLGLIDQYDANNKPYRAYVDRWEWRLGLCIADWRSVVRIANIDKSDLKALTTTQALTASTSLVKLMASAIDRVPTGPSKLAFYTNRTVISNLRILAMEKTSNVLGIEAGLSQFGRPGGTLTFMGIPVRRVDQMLSNEAVVA